MPLILLAALVGSLGIHAAALFGTDYELFGAEPEPPAPLHATLKAPPLPPAAPPAPKVVAKARPVAAKPKLLPADTVDQRLPVSTAAPVKDDATAKAISAIPENAPSGASTVASDDTPPQPLLPASGALHFSIYKESLSLLIGEAEHRWTFAADGSYRLTGVTRTSGVVALFKSLSMRNESAGRLTAKGLQPAHFRTFKNEAPARENADFDWSTGEVHLDRDDSTQAIAPGTQDILSLNYQLAYLADPASGTQIGVVTGKKYQRYAIDSLGEESLITPAGTFRTLHLRVAGETLTEIWIALDHQRLPVKIRFTDRKGDSYMQVLDTFDPALASP
ncbi:MAG: DUF3108 domain-containing protein [Azonexus sp.]|nr:DUF3108 domain-containing protein [Azonexus sp.]